jgi:hypothetical protein
MIIEMIFSGLIYHETRNCDEILTTTDTRRFDLSPCDRTGYIYSVLCIMKVSGIRTVWCHFKDDPTAIHDLGMRQVIPAEFPSVDGNAGNVDILLALVPCLDK